MSDDKKADPSSISDDMKVAIRKEVISKISKGIVAGGISLVLLILGASYILVKSQLPSWLGSVPEGAVVAFNIRAGCPDGWNPYERASGRTIVGALYSGTEDRPYLEHEILDASNYHFDERRGEERIALGPENMANHSHEFRGNAITMSGKGTVHGYNQNARPALGSTADVNTDLPISGTVMSEVNGGEKFSTMPPYVALYYCEKVAS
ncbi:hypothetical protein [Lentilitoribacter sp. EG35]|uniref:hypothetical protein n=1 Tax=Lentilitoribacter sp. EG35 TaxID=3234192 RepID=UPI003460CF61